MRLSVTGIPYEGFRPDQAILYNHNEYGDARLGILPHAPRQGRFNVRHISRLNVELDLALFIVLIWFLPFLCFSSTSHAVSAFSKYDYCYSFTASHLLDF